MREGLCRSMKTGKTLWTIDEGVVESLKEVLMSGITMCVGGLDADDAGVTRQFEGRKAA